jgi:hypothetical protein
VSRYVIATRGPRSATAAWAAGFSGIRPRYNGEMPFPPSSEVGRDRWIARAVVVANVLLLWVLPVLPMQDLPQHMAYVRIMADYDRPDLPFRDLYVLPGRAQPYFTVYYLLVALARLGSVMVAVRVVYSLFVVLAFWAFRDLLASAQPSNQQRSVRGALLASLAIWSPTVVMGFSSYTLALPFVLWGCAAAVRLSARTSRRDIVVLGACGTALVSLHPVSAGALTLFLLITAAVAPTRRMVVVTLAGLGAMAAAVGFWAVVGEQGTGSFSGVDWSAAAGSGFGFDIITNALQIQWSNPPAKLTALAWHVLGPFRLWDQVVRFGALVAAGAALARWRPRSATAGASALFKRATLLFLVAAWLAPWGLKVPSEITFLDFRLMTVGLFLVLACVPLSLLEGRRPLIALGALASFCTVQFGARSLAFSREARDALALLEEAPAGGRLLALTFHNQSAHFGAQFRLTHNLPLYYTIRSGGVTSQFWARYTDHLPVGYREGQSLALVGEWAPWELKAADIHSFDYVLLEQASANDPAKAQRGARLSKAILDEQARLVRCAGAFCLYAVGR